LPKHCLLPFCNIRDEDCPQLKDKETEAGMGAGQSDLRAQLLISRPPRSVCTGVRSHAMKQVQKVCATARSHVDNHQGSQWHKPVAKILKLCHSRWRDVPSVPGIPDSSVLVNLASPASGASWTCLIPVTGHRSDGPSDLVQT
jgi:hypothetical protein